MPDNQITSERELFLRIARGDELAFNEVFYRYHKRFYAAAVKMTHSQPVAEELVQDVFVTLWKKRGQLQHIEKPFSYLFTSLYNSIYTHLKKIASENQRLANAGNPPKITHETGEKLLLAKEQQQIVNNAINLLPDQQKKVYQLIKQQGLSREEAAKKLGISPNTVRNHLQQAQKTLRLHLRKLLPLFIFILYLHK